MDNNQAADPNIRIAPEITNNIGIIAERFILISPQNKLFQKNDIAIKFTKTFISITSACHNITKENVSHMIK
jgi:hypothetical protein